MPVSTDFMSEIERSVAEGTDWDRVLARILMEFKADSGTIHLLAEDGLLHLVAASAAIPEAVRRTVRTVPVGKGMAGLAVERGQPVNICNIETDTSGDVRPGARATGLQGSIVVPILDGDRAVGALGIANHHERTFSDDEAGELMDIGRRLAVHRPIPFRGQFP